MHELESEARCTANYSCHPVRRCPSQVVLEGWWWVHFARGLRDCEWTDPAEKRRREGAVSKRGHDTRGPFYNVPSPCLFFSGLI
eukprot:scaffold2183_cov140-Isochrysis_galbana.AAC.9